MTSSSNHDLSPTILVYLPRGSDLFDVESDGSTLNVFRSHVHSHIVQVNYRLSREHKFPTPVHDVLAGYDWILENLLPKRSITRPRRSDHVGRVAVCGELIGGGLATALALTECRLGELGIIAAAVNNPLVDWVSLDDAPLARSKYSTRGTLQVPSLAETNEFLSLRKELFKRPGAYFDPFASPILFFRSAGANVPPPPLASYEDNMEHLSVIEREEFFRQYGADGDSKHSVDTSEEDATSEKPPRKASKRFPSKSLGLRLPSFHITAGSMSPLTTQAAELTNLLRQSIARQSKHASSNPHDFGRKVLLEGEEDDEMDDDQLMKRNLHQAEAEEKAMFTTEEGLGLWDSTTEGKARVLRMAHWLNDRLR